MKFEKKLNDRDLELAASFLKDFVPDEVYDIHAHLYHPAHFAPGAWGFLGDAGILGCEEHRRSLGRYLPAKTLHGLYFGLPHRSADTGPMNGWVREETALHGTSISRPLRLTMPDEDPLQVADDLRKGRFCGLKVYHVYASRSDTMNAGIAEFAPEWMWEVLHETKGILMLHIVRSGGIDDAGNQADLRRLCRTYPGMRLVLAHVARSFNYRNARKGLQALEDLDNVVVDTSAVCEAEAFRAALRALSPRRILWGSDFPVSEVRGRCITTGGQFYWLHPADTGGPEPRGGDEGMTLVGVESLLALQELCADAGLAKDDIRDIFLDNALRLLRPHLPPEVVPRESSGTELWQRANGLIAGGTGLLSKRADMFPAEHWPSYFSRCSGCQVWDLNGKRYIDFAGGIGAVLLGYADPDVTAAVQRRLSQGSYCSLASPQEVELAEVLLKLHPWAGKVRYARGGGEAMTVAVRLARAATGKSGVAFCGYHGWHDWYLAANLAEDHALDGHLLPGLSPGGVPRELRGTSVPFRYNDRASLDIALGQLKGNLAAVVMEPMRSQWPADDFLEQAAGRCRAADAVLIIDEITSGLRYGFPGALSRFGLEPDIVVYAKAMSNGFPFAAIIGREKVLGETGAGFISSSYWTDGVGPAATLAVLEKVERLDVSRLIWERGAKLQGSLQQVAARYPSCMMHIEGMPATPTMTFRLGELAPAARRFYAGRMQEEGYLVGSIFYLMLAHEEHHITGLVEATGRVLGELEHLLASGELAGDNGNTGKRPGSGFTRLA